MSAITKFNKNLKENFKKIFQKLWVSRTESSMDNKRKNAVRRSVSLRFFYFFLTFVFLSGCTQIKHLTKYEENSSKQTSFTSFTKELSEAQSLFSTRPQNLPYAIFILKLHSPALLSKLLLKKEADTDLASQIEKEQTATITSLQQIDSEIKVIMRYRLVLNALVIIAPTKHLEQIEKLESIEQVEWPQNFDQPKAVSTLATPTIANLNEMNSALFIGAGAARAKNILGQQIKVGVIDTGVDYTHAMLGGGSIGYKSIDPNATNSSFPNQKVVGGFDFAGSTYNPSSPIFADRIPKPDANPIDESGHGTHVAGSIAGIGDGIKTYDGVAPQSLLYALKVFGTNGSTSEEVVVAALEYAADPNQDGDLSDHLDVVNLSLGAAYGSPKDVYNTAIRNLTLGGTVVVVAAGNSGNKPTIVASPGGADEGLCVAASVDGMDHNWKFPTVAFTLPDSSVLQAQAVEGSLTKPIADLGDNTKASSGELVYIGLANQDLSEEMRSALQGKVALIDRGLVTFAEKLNRALGAGALGVVMVNNLKDEGPIGMDGDVKIAIPGIMITQALGNQIKEALKKGIVRIEFKTNQCIETPEVIDTVAGFSSRGPRFEDSIIKPEIAGPGVKIISAKMGSGDQGVSFSGTSMAAPHLAGVMALLKQAYPQLTPAELKSVVMGTAKTMMDTAAKKAYTVTRVGAGRVQIDKALSASVISQPSAISLGEVRIESSKRFTRPLSLTNLTDTPLTLNGVFEGHSSLTLPPLKITIAAHSSQIVSFAFTLTSPKLPLEEVDGYIKLLNPEGSEVLRVPVLAVVRKISDIQPEKLIIHSSSPADADGADAELEIRNDSPEPGKIIPLNLIGKDARKEDPSRDVDKSRACDLQAAGYKIVNGKLYIGIKLYEQVSSWHLCEIAVLFDANNDKIPDQELVGTQLNRLPGLPPIEGFASMLLDANKMRQLRKAYEEDIAKAIAEGKDPEKVPPPNYASAIDDLQDMAYFDHSSIAFVVADLEKLKKDLKGQLTIQIATTALDDSNVVTDDFLTRRFGSRVDVSELGQGFVFHEFDLDLAPKSDNNFVFTKGQGAHNLLILSPTNRSVLGSQALDSQMFVLKPKFK